VAKQRLDIDATTPRHEPESTHRGAGRFRHCKSNTKATELDIYLVMGETADKLRMIKAKHP
jgi:hypothetical protein